MKKIILAIIILIIIVPVLVGGYLGIIPGVSAIFDANKPKNLQIATTSQNLQTATAKTQVITDALPKDQAATKSLIYQGSHNAEFTITSQELTALANNSKWVNNPISEVQVRLNADGSGEASGLVDFNTALKYASTFGVSQTDIDTALAKFPIPKTKFPFYIKLSSGSITNNRISASIDSVQLARINVPASIINQYQPAAKNFLESTYFHEGAINALKVENRQGELYFQGDLPDRELTLQK